MKCINVIGDIRVKLIANHVKEINLELKEMKAKVEYISVRVNLLTKLPRLITLKSMPPRATFQKPILLESKNQVLHMKLVCFILLILKKFITTMKIINVVAFEESVLFNVDANVPAYKADENGAMVQTEDTSFSMSYADLARQCYPLNADIAELRSLRGQHLSGEDWIKLLTGATVTVDFKFVNANDEIDGYTYENTGYIKTIKSLRLDDRVAARLDRALGF